MVTKILEQNGNAHTNNNIVWTRRTGSTRRRTVVSEDRIVVRKKIAEFVNETMPLQLLTSDSVAYHQLPAKTRKTCQANDSELFYQCSEAWCLEGSKNLKGTRHVRKNSSSQTMLPSSSRLHEARDIRSRHIDSTNPYNGKVYLKKSQSASPPENKEDEEFRPFFSWGISSCQYDVW